MSAGSYDRRVLRWRALCFASLCAWGLAVVGYALAGRMQLPDLQTALAVVLILSVLVTMAAATAMVVLGAPEPVAGGPAPVRIYRPRHLVLTGVAALLVGATLGVVLTLELWPWIDQCYRLRAC